MSGIKIEQDSGFPFDSKGRLRLRADAPPADAYKSKGRSYVNARDMYANIEVPTPDGTFAPIGDFIKHGVINVKAAPFNAKSDGVTDDAAAIQAALNAGLESGKQVFVPSSNAEYDIATGLTFGTGSANLYIAASIVGEGQGSLGRNGSSFKLTGTGHTAVLTVKKDAWRTINVEKLGVLCATEGGASYGVLMDSSEISQLTFKDLLIENPDVAIGLLDGTGANGEFCQFENIRASGVDSLFYTDAGQAFQPSFNTAFIIGRGDSDFACFDLNYTDSGGGLRANDIHVSQSGQGSATDTMNTKFLKVRGIPTSPMTFIGGRVEWCTQIIDWDTTSADGVRQSQITFLGTEFTLDNSRGNAQNTLDAVINLQATGLNGTASIIRFMGCRFASVGAFTDTVFNVVIDKFVNCTLIFEECSFRDFERLPYVECGAQSRSTVEFRNCIGNWSNNSGSSNRKPVRFSKRFDALNNFGGNIVERRTRSQIGVNASGKRVNHIQIPQFREATGTAANTAADSPWVHAGTSSDFGIIWDWSARSSQSYPKSESEWSKAVQLKATSSVYQDLTGIDLNSTNINYGGANGKIVVYQALLNAFSGGTQFRFALENSSSGKIYDEMIFDNVGAVTEPTLITLMMAADLTATGDLRLKIENTGAATILLDFAWQFCTDDLESVFAATSTASVEGETRWGSAVENAYIWSRLRLPYKQDTYGADASPAHDDLASDIYLSSNTEKLTFYANSGWHRLPRPEVSANNGDAAATLTVAADEETQIWDTALTANRAVTLSTTNAYNGAKFRIVRTANATGAFNLNVGTGPLKAMGTAGSFSEVEYNGTAWILTAYGTL